MDRAAAGMTPNPTDSRAQYVQSIAINNGVLVVTYGGAAHPAITNLTLTITPYETAGRDIIWRCGSAPAPPGLNLLGTAAGVNVATYIAPTVPDVFLPASCRP